MPGEFVLSSAMLYKAWIVTVFAGILFFVGVPFGVGYRYSPFLIVFILAGFAFMVLAFFLFLIFAPQLGVI